MSTRRHGVRVRQMMNFFNGVSKYKVVFVLRRFANDRHVSHCSHNVNYFLVF